MTIEMIKKALPTVISHYPITRIVLFGSRAEGTNKVDSDIDLIIDFNAPITLITLSQIKYELEETLGLEVDVIHGPIQETDLLEVGKVVELYAA